MCVWGVGGGGMLTEGRSLMNMQAPFTGRGEVPDEYANRIFTGHQK